ncbi:MAG: hypothetical protein LBP24_00170 [Coriobacteriales bacterium]|jgi:hypothetical protein|nr:hypothetical protein [Coriobacteriales bacterium]
MKRLEKADRIIGYFTLVVVLLTPAIDLCFGRSVSRAWDQTFLVLFRLGLVILVCIFWHSKLKNLILGIKKNRNQEIEKPTPLRIFAAYTVLAVLVAAVIILMEIIIVNFYESVS